MTPTRKKTPKGDMPRKSAEERSTLRELPAREAQLKTELARLDELLADKRKLVEKLRTENDWLKDEIDKSQGETHEYINYLVGKTNKKQELIISLADRNQTQLATVEQDKVNIFRTHEEIKRKLKQTILDLEGELVRKNRELEKLGDEKVKRSEQREEVKRLEAALLQMKEDHAERIEKMKSDFLKDKLECQRQADTRVASMQNKATSEAMECLQEQTLRIKHENFKLRAELVSLIQQSKALQKKKESLETQNRALRQDRELSEDMQRLKKMRISRASVGGAGSGRKALTAAPATTPSSPRRRSTAQRTSKHAVGHTASFLQEQREDSEDDNSDLSDFYD